MAVRHTNTKVTSVSTASDKEASKVFAIFDEK